MAIDLFQPEIFATKLLKIRDKNKELVPLAWNNVQRHFHKNRTGRDIILKARQLGMSTYIQGEMFRRTVTTTRTTITLAHDSDTTQKLRRMAERFYENFPDYPRPARKYANASLATYPEFDSTAIIATAGNKQAGRGDTYTDFHGSEVAFWPDAEKIIAGAMQGGNPDVILESTPNGAQGHFYDLCMDALDGGGVWKLHFYPWWWDAEYKIEREPGEIIDFTPEEFDLVQKHALSAEQIKWRRLKQDELKRLFSQEYPEDPIQCFLTSGNSYFGDISECFTAPLSAEYDSRHVYCAGLDWGQTGDFTAMIVLDATTGDMVDYMRIKNLSWTEMRKRVNQLGHKWNVQVVHAEYNSIGSVNIEELRKLNLRVVPFNTSNESKALVMSALHEALENNTLKLQDWNILRHELNIFVSTQLPSMIWRLAADGRGHDDTVIALALAYYAIRVLAIIQDGGPSQVVYDPVKIGDY